MQAYNLESYGYLKMGIYRRVYHSSKFVDMRFVVMFTFFFIKFYKSSLMESLLENFIISFLFSHMFP